jgi:hypothetical protein
VYRTYKVGPRTLPCGTPAFIGCSSDFLFPTLTWNFRSLQNKVVEEIVWSCIAGHYATPYQRPSWRLGTLLHSGVPKSTNVIKSIWEVCTWCFIAGYEKGWTREIYIWFFMTVMKGPLLSCVRNLCEGK